MSEQNGNEIARDYGRLAEDGRPVHRAGDHAVSALAFAGHIRAFACRTNETVEEARRLHDLSPVAAAALGRLLSGAALMARDLKDESGDTSLSIRCDGPLRGLFALASAAGDLRGYVLTPQVESSYHRPGKLNVGAAVGTGKLTIIKNNQREQPYSSQVELISGEIAEDLNYYLAASEQIPSVVALGVRLGREGVQTAGGLLIQLMPGAPESLIDYLEQRAAGFPDVSGLLAEGFDPAELIDLFLGDPELRYLSVAPLRYHCPCSRRRMEAGLCALGRSELDELAKDAAGIELECHFCDRRYHFSQDEVRTLRAAADPAQQ